MRRRLYLAGRPPIWGTYKVNDHHKYYNKLKINQTLKPFVSKKINLITGLKIFWSFYNILVWGVYSFMPKIFN